MSVRVGFVSCDNYYSRTAWSGTLYSMHQALKSTDLNVIDLGNPSKPSGWPALWNRVARRLARHLGKNDDPGKRGSPQHEAQCKAFAARVGKQMRRTPCQVLFVAMIDAELNYLDIKVPIVKMSDATFPLIREGYDLKLDKEETDWVVRHEALAIARARKLIYPSEWAARSAVHDYHADPGNIVVIPFGANIEAVPALAKVLAPRGGPPCRLFFCGREWDRKGGAIAFQVLTALLQRGVDAELTVLGCVPPGGLTHPKLKVIPFLNKNVPEEREQILNLFLNSHYFVLPTRADCSPIVICEANAFGLPVLTTDVGGIPTLIRNGTNGYMLPLSASGADYAEVIGQSFSDPARFANLVRSSRQEYDQRLNWKKWAEDVRDVVQSVAGKTSPS